MLFRSHVTELPDFKMPTAKSIGARPKLLQIALKDEDMGRMAKFRAHVERPFPRTSRALPDLDRGR